ncbi:MAG: hypothetical protein J1E39_10035 [Eubacterium sp.]|nr:hypothetical protein [Eubacterium sp.]
MFTLNLRLFDGDGGASTGAGDSSGAVGKGEKNSSSAGAQASKMIGQQPSPAGIEPEVQSNTQIDRAKEFENLIKGDYKAEYDKRVQEIVKSRFKDVDAIKKSNDEKQTLLDRIGAKYGVDPTDLKALGKAIDEDDGFYEKAAKESGQTVEQFKKTRELEAELARMKRIEKSQEAENQFRAKLVDWQQQGETVKQMYPNFDFRNEMQNKEFFDLLNRGIDVRTAFEVLHKDEIIGGAMAYTAQQIHQQTVNDIRSRGMRHQEGAVASQAGATTGFDVSKLDKKGREDLIRRAARGEKISF